MRAHEVHRTELSTWVVATFSNMAIPLGSPNDALGTEVPVNPEYWSGSPLPNTVAPTFTACNITRFYELEVRVGLGYGSYEYGKDQLVILPLRLPVQVYSGIAPHRAQARARNHRWRRWRQISTPRRRRRIRTRPLRHLAQLWGRGWDEYAAY